MRHYRAVTVLRPCTGDVVLFPNGSAAAIRYVVEDDAVVHLINGQIVLLKDLSLSPDENQNLWVFTWVFTGHSLSPSKIEQALSDSFFADDSGVIRGQPRFGSLKILRTGMTPWSFDWCRSALQSLLLPRFSM